MSSFEPPRPEYEDRVARHLTRTLIGEDLRVHHWGHPVRFENVRRQRAEAGESSMVVTFRLPGEDRRPFGRREDAVGPPEPWEDPRRDAPEGWADMVWISPVEDLEIGPDSLKRCEPGVITWV